METSHKHEYRLRNNPDEAFQIHARVTRSGKSGLDGAQVTADIQHVSGRSFRFVVEFSGDFVATKENFTPDMFLHTAVSIVCSQLESRRYKDTLLAVHSHSGLTRTSEL